MELTYSIIHGLLKAHDVIIDSYVLPGHLPHIRHCTKFGL